MKLQAKIGTLSLSLTVVVMFFTITKITPLVNAIEPLKFIGTLLISIALYKTIANGLFKILNSSLWLRKKILGEEFLEGTWVGKIKRTPIEYTVEQYRFVNGEIEIEGQSYLEDKTMKSHWTSKAFGLDMKNRKLVYAYECRTEGVEKPPEGVASFGLQWSDSNLKSCDILEGFAADLSDGKKDSNKEYKASDACLSFDDGFEQAVKIFAEKT